MKTGPDFARIAALIGDPARANMLGALMDGGARTATELAMEAGVTVQTASAHLAKLETGGLLRLRKQGRHRYFALADEDVAALLEKLMGVSARLGGGRHRPGPKEPALRHARVCYDHLAGDLGVALFEALARRDLIVVSEEAVDLTPAGQGFFAGFGVDVDALKKQRRPVCRSCLDWSVRRFHLAGGLGAALLSQILERGWARRLPGERILRFSRAGEAAFREAFGAV